MISVRLERFNGRENESNLFQLLKAAILGDGTIRGRRDGETLEVTIDFQPDRKAKEGFVPLSQIISDQLFRRLVERTAADPDLMRRRMRK